MSEYGRASNSDFKTHLISGFCCTDGKWPLQLWNNLTKQALITLNLCRTSRKYPGKSAHHSFYGQLGQELQCMKRWQEERRGRQEASMVGIVYQHLITIATCVFYIPETKVYRTSAFYDLFPQHCQLLTLSDQQHTKEVAKEWIESIQRLKNKPKKAAIKDLKKQSTQ